VLFVFYFFIFSQKEDPTRGIVERETCSGNHLKHQFLLLLVVLGMKRGVSKSFLRFKESIKRLAKGSPNKDNKENSGEIVSTVTPDSDGDDWFENNFEMMDPIGKGGFATVYTCKKRGSGEKYAVKVVDIRPLRLKESFKPAQLQREVDIMRKLRHPNIIEFVGSQQRPDSLLMVMEYAPGKELFEVN
jgi:serine/threonine protein kinase